MSIANYFSTRGDSERAEILNRSNPDDFDWAMPIMSAGYAGRGLVYLIVAGVSLWSVWQGGQAEGTGSALRSMDGWVGSLVVTLIAAGMFAYAIWRYIDSFWDLEAYGTSAKGIVARTGMVVTGTLHAGIGVIAITALGYGRSGGGGRSMLSSAMQTDWGSWLIGTAGALTIGAGLYYIYKAISQSYRDNLQANHFTLHWNPMLRAGLTAQGISIAIIGGLILYAAITVDASQAGGLGSAFDWLLQQSYGKFLVIILCLGLLCFSLFCFVNAAFRIIPKAADDSVQNLASQLKS